MCRAVGWRVEVGQGQARSQAPRASEDGSIDTSKAADSVVVCNRLANDRQPYLELETDVGAQATLKREVRNNGFTEIDTESAEVEKLADIDIVHGARSQL